MQPLETLYAPPKQIIEGEPQTRSSARYVTISCPADPPPDQALRLLETSGALDFWDATDEDIYSPGDGTPI